MATRRLMKEHSSFEKTPLDYISLTVDESDMYTWKCIMTGPPDTPYAGGLFQLKVEFPTQYPFKPPSITFVTKTYHPSVETESGKICADVLTAGWGPTLNLRHCLNLIYGMLQAPDADHPLQEDIATMMREKPKEFEKTAKKYTKEYAK